jgi:D-alanyl-D-alanine carboxypeptidase/D-alanyl-D-alanine-endopeptidase (penicillin-binding protein 4)
LLGPLGEGDARRGEAKPRFRLDSFDCVTFLETSLALARARDTSDLLVRMDSIRYLDGRVEWRWRNHFFEGDWLPRNAARVALVRFPEDTMVARRLARKGFFAKKGFDVPDTSVELHLLWRDRAMVRYSKPSDSARLRGVALVGKVDGYPVLHTGFLVERKGAPAMLRHASQAGSVREQPFADYLREKTKFVGVIVWEVLP